MEIHDENYHWNECLCGAIKDKAAHTWEKKTDDSHSWEQCACGVIKGKEAHIWMTAFDDKNHWQECTCGMVKGKAAHSWVKKSDDKYHWEKCACGAVKGKAAHTVVVDAAVEATCTETGLTAGSHCSVCGEILKAQEVVKAKGHTEVVDAAVEATCTETGLTAGSHCSVCGEVLKAQEVVKAKGHTEVADAAVEATCTTAGKTAGSHCSVCGEILKAQEVVKAKGHTEVVDAAVEATCTTAGKTAGSHCSVCGTVIKAQEEVPVKDHTPAAAVKENEKAAQIGVAGSYEEVVYCKDCGAEISRTTREIPALPKKGNSANNNPAPYSNGASAGETATDDSSLISDITGAENEDDEPVIVMLGQLSNVPETDLTNEMKADMKDLENSLADAIEAISDISIPPDGVGAEVGEDCSLFAGGPFRAVASSYPATITIELTDPYAFVDMMVFINGKWTKLDTVQNDDGTVTFILDQPSVLSIVYAVSEPEGTYNQGQGRCQDQGHTEVPDAAVEPTCTKTGLTAGSHCSVCGEVLKAQEVVKAKGHTEVADAAVTATCMTAGKTAGSHCSECGAVIKAQETVPAKGHSPAAATIENEKAAQVGVAGSYEEVVYCRACGVELSRKRVETDPLPEPEPQPEPQPEKESDPTPETDNPSETSQEDNGTGKTSVISKNTPADTVAIKSIAGPNDVSCYDDDVILQKLGACPDSMIETASREVTSLKRGGYKIDAGFGVWSESGKTASCTINLSGKDVPDGSQIFVNGSAVYAELKDGYYYFEVTPPSVVIIAHK